MKALKKILLLFVVLSFLFSLNAEDIKGKGTHFYFVQVTDTHFGAPESLERTEKIVELINNLPMRAEFVACTGDIVDKGMTDEKAREDALRTFKNLKLPVHYVAGNHDVKLKKPENDKVLFEKDFGKLFSKAEYGGVVFYFIYMEAAVYDRNFEGFDAWGTLEKNLQEDKGKPVIIFTHSPPCSDFHKNKLNDFWKPEALSRFITLVNSCDVKAVITGHFHRDELHWLEKVPLFTAPPVAAKFGRQGTCRIYEYDNGKIGYWTQYLNKN